MIVGNVTPRWIDKLERKIGWLSLPNLALYLVVLQIFGFLVCLLKPSAQLKLVLDPEAVAAGQYWRLLTFLGMPLATDFWIIIVIWFLYFIVQSLENSLGEFKTTLYFTVSVLLTVAFAFVFNVRIDSITYIQSSLFLAAATLYPETEILLFFVIPIKLKWLGWLTAAYIIFVAIMASWLLRLYLVTVFLNYLMFFGVWHFSELKSLIRRKRYLNRK